PDKAVNRLRASNCYEDNWKNSLRYFLLRYEDHLRSKTHRAPLNYHSMLFNELWDDFHDLTIEHICPQKPTPTWDGIIDSDRSDCINRLGNLLLLPKGVNSKASDQSFSQKKLIYATCKIWMASEVMSKPIWDRGSIEERE